ncbi:ETX/MTX2 family pore-forming toxin [Desulfobacter sp.]|uniref:ETX/MTX2 family pore-forming toxin n=1 Tax=Desulfobacter sp. TaxID=2294 RepID=UPI00257CC2D0|nr:ETX/MTX2 family pore-forming toxin [Desulfobacter sp.]
MNSSIKISDDLQLYTGDLITLRAEDATFLKRYDSLEGHSALFTYLKKPDDFSNFVVEVIDSDKIRLIADNGCYLKRFCCWENMSFVSMDSPSPDAFSVFTIRSKGGSKVTLQAENGNYLKRYFGYNGLSLITVYQSHEDPFSVFQVARGGTKAKEAVKDIKFDLEKLTKSTQPFAVGTQTLRNNSDEEQTMDFKVSKTVTTEKSFKWGTSFEIGVSTEFSCGVPLLAEGKVEVSMKMGFSLGGSQSDSDSQTLEATFPVTCRGNTVMRADAIVQLGRVDVPYEATISRYLIDGNNTTTEYTYLVKGTYHGINAFNLTYVVNKVDK